MPCWGMNKYINCFPKLRSAINEALKTNSIEEQKNIYEKRIKPKLWNPILKFIMRRHITMSLIGVPQAQRVWLEKDFEGGVAQFIESSLDAVFSKLSLKDNYFWKVYLTGEYSETCCPEYLTPNGFSKLKQGLWENISIYTGSLLDIVPTISKPISHFVLLDHMDWLSQELSDVLVSEWNMLLEHPGARIIWRSASKSSQFIDELVIPGKNKKVGDFITHNHSLAQKLHLQDRVHTYGSFAIADLAA